MTWASYFGHVITGRSHSTLKYSYRTVHNFAIWDCSCRDLLLVIFILFCSWQKFRSKVIEYLGCCRVTGQCTEWTTHRMETKFWWNKSLKWNRYTDNNLETAVVLRKPRECLYYFVTDKIDVEAIFHSAPAWTAIQQKVWRSICTWFVYIMDLHNGDWKQHHLTKICMLSDASKQHVLSHQLITWYFSVYTNLAWYRALTGRLQSFWVEWQLSPFHTFQMLEWISFHKYSLPCKQRTRNPPMRLMDV